MGENQSADSPLPKGGRQDTQLKLILVIILILFVECLIYRHPTSNLDKFMDYINSTIESINQGNKFCIFMGDFNIDL